MNGSAALPCASGAIGGAVNVIDGHIAGNPGNAQARVQPSLLKDRVLRPGRGVALGVRVFF